MTDLAFIQDDVSEWAEIPRLEALLRLENLMTVDIVSIEIDVEEIPTPVGQMITFQWTAITDFGERPLMMLMRDVDPDKPARWFLHKDLVIPDGLD